MSFHILRPITNFGKCFEQITLNLLIKMQRNLNALILKRST